MLAVLDPRSNTLNAFLKVHVQVAGYAIYIAFIRSLSDNHLVLQSSLAKDINDELEKCASWYLINIIGQRSAEFEHFRL
jgi:hypothetical protein